MIRINNEKTVIYKEWGHGWLSQSGNKANNLIKACIEIVLNFSIKEVSAKEPSPN